MRWAVLLLLFPGAFTQNFHSLKRFSKSQILFLALRLYCPSCTCLYCEVCCPPVPAQSFPYKKALFQILETAVSSCSEQAFEHTHIPLQGISGNSFLLAYYMTLLFWGLILVRCLPKSLMGSRRDPCNAPMNHLFLTLDYLGLFIPNMHVQYKFGVHCNPAENLYANNFHL